MSQAVMFIEPASFTPSKQKRLRHSNLRYKTFALAEVRDKALGKSFQKFKFQKQVEIDRKATERLRAFIDSIANKD